MFLLKIGESVVSYNKDLNIFEDKLIEKVYHNLSVSKNNMYQLTMEDDSIIKITGNHKVMLSCGEWKKVEKLLPSDDIKDFNIEN